MNKGDYPDLRTTDRITIVEVWNSEQTRCLGKFIESVKGGWICVDCDELTDNYLKHECSG